MSSQVVHVGLAELFAQLETLPVAVTNDAQAIVVAQGEQTADAIRAAYPPRARSLAATVAVVPAAHVPTLGAGVDVVNRAPHAHLFEAGTRTRQTKLGAPRGSMPPGRVFGPQVEKGRALMDARLAEMLRRHGFEVPSDVAAG